MQAHRGDDDLAHRSAQDNLARTKSKVWIHQGLQLTRRIVKDCPVCKKDKHKLQQQRIGRLPSSMLEPCPPFTNIALDYAGPFLVKGTVNARSRKKVWLILITCKNTRALEIMVVDGYDTAAFLLKWEEYISRHGEPDHVQVDAGSS